MGKNRQQIGELISYLPQVTLEIDPEKGGGYENFVKHASLRCILREIDFLRKENRKGLFTQQKRAAMRLMRQNLDGENIEALGEILRTTNEHNNSSLNEQKIAIRNLEDLSTLATAGNSFDNIDMQDMLDGLFRDAEATFIPLKGKKVHRKNKIILARKKLVTDYIIPKVLKRERPSIKTIAVDTDLSVSHVLRILHDPAMTKFFKRFLSRNGISQRANI
jgi:hypothetical protein